MAEKPKTQLERLSALETQFGQIVSEQRALRAMIRVHENQLRRLEKRLDPLERESNVRAEMISRRLAV